MKKLILLILLMLFSFSLFGCSGTNVTTSTKSADTISENQKPTISGTSNFTIAYGQTVDFMKGVTASDEEDGELTSSIQVDKGDFDNSVPGDYEITYTVTDSDGAVTTITVIVTVNEKDGPTAEEMVDADIAYYSDHQYYSDGRLNFYKRGGTYQSSITWSIDSEYVAPNGLFLPPTKGSSPVTVDYSGVFAIGDVSKKENYSITIDPVSDVVLTNSRVVPFENLTTEYDVQDGSLTLYYADGGSVPYVDVEDFFELLQGFIDPGIDISFTQNDDILTLAYQYYDDTEDKTYDLEVDIDATNDTITTNDMGFYWAYVYSTATNYGRHINYVSNPDEYYSDGENVVFNLDDYRLDIVQNDNGIFLPFYLVNQIFVGSSYYNVYYNYDGLYGVYGTIDSDSDEYETIHTSSMNNQSLPIDLILNNYDMLAFDLDYFYGLKEYDNIDTFYNVISEKQADLLSLNAGTFDQGLFNLLYKTIDEPHTSFGAPSYYTSSYNSGPSVTSISDFGGRTRAFYSSLYAIDDAIGAKWGYASGNNWNADSGNRPDYWFLDDAKTSAVITLDDFNTSDIVETNAFDANNVNDVLNVDDSSAIVPSITQGTKFFYYNSSTDDNKILEMIVEGVNSDYLAQYLTKLDNLGYTLVQQDTYEDAKDNGYYYLTVGDITYMSQVNYDSTYGVFYVGFSDAVPENYSDDWLFIGDVMETVKADSAVYMEVIMNKLAEVAPNLDNAILDITWNTGGNVGALYRVIGFITDQPFRVSTINVDSGAESTSYIQIVDQPFNANLSWALLTSGATFSAANQMATIFSENKLGPICGIKTGGGTASITPVLLPSGTAFIMSSNNLSAIRLGLGTEEDPYIYVNNETGITPDISISIDDIYDNVILMSVFNR